jgi:hypothetical protein
VIDDPSKPHPEDLKIDLTDLKEILCDLPPTDFRSLRTQKPGEEEVRRELIDNQPQHGEAAGITAEDVALVVECSENVEKIAARRGRVVKALEILDESTAYWIDRRERKYTAMREKADTSYKETRNEQIRAKFEKLPGYCGQTAAKAARTRRRRASNPKAEAILLTLSARGIALEEADREKIAGSRDQAALDRWLARAGAIARLAELFA